MTVNAGRKNRARELAAAKGIAYTTALRQLQIIEAMQPDPELLEYQRQYAAWVISFDDPEDVFRSPYPWWLDSAGFIQRQDFWRGDPLFVVGFSRSPGAGKINITWAEAAANPAAIKGLYPVTAEADGTWATRGLQVSGLEEVSPTDQAVEHVTATFRFSRNQTVVTADVRQWLACFNDDALTALRASGWLFEDDRGETGFSLVSIAASREARLDSLPANRRPAYSAAVAEYRAALKAFFEALDDFEGSGNVMVKINAREADAYLASRHSLSHLVD